jgi:hypothetical protein
MAATLRPLPVTDQLSDVDRYRDDEAAGALEGNEGVNYADWSIPRQQPEAYAARRGPRGVITVND